VSERNSIDEVIEVYKRSVDRTLIRECLKLSVDDRFRRLQEFEEVREELQRATREARDKVR
jgi:hypothetical protein